MGCKSIKKNSLLRIFVRQTKNFPYTEYLYIRPRTFRTQNICMSDQELSVHRIFVRQTKNFLYTEYLYVRPRTFCTQDFDNWGPSCRSIILRFLWHRDEVLPDLLLFFSRIKPTVEYSVHSPVSVL